MHVLWGARRGFVPSAGESENEVAQVAHFQVLLSKLLLQLLLAQCEIAGSLFEDSEGLTQFCIFLLVEFELLVLLVCDYHVEAFVSHLKCYKNYYMLVSLYIVLYYVF